nr:phosphate ABC transporter permease subunit PstC [Candidatus Soleaferrea massiliensis]
MERVFEWIFLICACAAILSVVVITAYMLISGGPAVFKVGIGDFLFGTEWAPTASDPKFGILPMILASLCATFGAILIGVPIGIFTSIFLSKMAPKRAAKFLKSAVELLAGIPSVVYGLIGMIIVVPAVAAIFNLPTGACLFSAIIVLAIMILPTVISISETSIRAVPGYLEEASLGLGATKIQTIFKVVIPAARSGIITSIVLGVGRAIGETMAVIMVAGNVVNLPELFGSVRLMTTGIVMEMSYADEFHKSVLFAIGLVLFVFIMVINISVNTVLKKASKKYE